MAGLYAFIIIFGCGIFLVSEFSGFFTILLAFLPLIIIFAIIATINEKRYHAGTRSIDSKIVMTRLIAVNGIEEVTHHGMLSRTIIGHELAGDVGALLGALSAEQVHRNNEFTFLVFYSDGTRKTEKVKQTSGRFQFLVSKLEDNQPLEYVEPASKQASAPKRIAAPKKAAKAKESTKTKKTKSSTKKKTVLVPVGDYTVGEDIPAGAYALSSDKYATVLIYNQADNANADTTYSCEEPYFAIGRINLKDGMRIRVNYASVRFEKFDGTDRWNLMKEGKPVLILQGEYTIGRDLLPGSYTLTSDRFCSILLYDAEDSEYSVDSYSLEEPDFMVGKSGCWQG